MYSPFYELRQDYPSRPSYFDSPPIMRGIRVNRPTQPVHKKVVSIPVHYVGSDNAVPISGSRSASESESAVKIQKVVRGYLVRKSMKKIAAIRKEVDGVEKSIASSGTVELIRRDPKERLKVNEMLMSLLFKLDSVRGVDSGVRNCRRAVTKKAIALQEMVDAIVDGDSSKNLAGAEKDVEQARDVEVNIDDSVSSGFESKENPVGESQNNDVQILLENQDGHSVSAPDSTEVQAMTAEEAPVEGNLGLNQGLHMNDEARGGEIDGKNDIVSVPAPSEAEVTSEVEERVEDSGLNLEDGVNAEAEGDEIEGKKEIDAMSNPGEIEAITEVKEGDAETLSFEHKCETDAEVRGHEIEEERETVGGEIDCECDGGETIGRSHCESQVASSVNHLGMMEGDESDAGKSSMEDDENVRKVQESDSAGTGDVAKDVLKEDGTRTRELLEKMLVDNEKMMDLMADLFERNAMQTRLLSCLSQRVEQLEKAYWCERLRRKKKRNAAMGLADCLESTQDIRKCGKKE